MATNEEVYEAAQTSNCLEFIEKNEGNTQIDDSALNLIHEMKNYKKEILEKIGEAEYD